MPLSWQEPLITGITLIGQEERCYNPAFAREWPGTAEYEIDVKTRRLLQDDPATSEEKAAEILTEYDLDGDGRLDEEEVAALIANSQLPFEDDNEAEAEAGEEE